jgi:hypothetical protein
MASPHVPGAIALLMEARPKNVRDIGVEGIRAALQNSADPHLWWGSPGLGFLDNVQRQGAGMLDIRAAIEATAVASPSKLSLGESQAGPQTRTLTLEDLKRDKAHETTYTLSHVPALSTGPDTFVPSFLTGFATVTFSAPTVTVKKNHSASVNVTITANASLPDRSLYGGYIVFSGDDGTTIRVPYSGFKGDYQSIQVLTPAGAIPTAGRQVAWANSGGAIAGSYSNTLLATYQFTMGPKPNPSGFGPATFDDIPYYLVHFNHQSSRATFTAYDAAGNVALGEAMSFSFLGRNSSATSFFAMGWDGSVGPANARTQLPNGTYLLRLTVLRALGDPTNPAHSETISFATVNIARP